ncbi:Rpn family recombination-promoting nuclease/putative transposase [Limnoraphis robusta]|uniref:Rpn family recombination-promoting nuclease/putative transposase n=1 Tax=Limnoraphis robusta CCNP1315 TaxID=3110306 RepID=A0ABU5TYV5_9CYAN|nr:Rpn family recombination-promoting nuclease/putative transposase [Limnoraphis robusta]MEA5519882.1 Rpn family recombination-promoting nuclease/putative transposase [Limnoraphis robusta CCNP1315]MEA5547917.1 Rpn family recombination-promoting nuclease/putative transposase [Limnoraphis robusta CCNP1324]
MAYDNLCKRLAEESPATFAQWLLGTNPGTIQVLKTELSLEPISADAITFLQTSEQILHLEFQTQPTSEPPLPLRMLDYWVRLYRKYRRPIQQFIIFLQATTSEVVFTEEFVTETTRHRYRVIRMWEQNPAIFLNDRALLPLAPLAQTNSPETLLTQVAAEVAKIEAIEQRRNVLAAVQIIAGLRYDKTLIQQLLREDIMRESVIYQDILQQGVRQGVQQGRGEGEASLIIRQLTRRFGELSPEVIQRIRSLSLPQLDALGEELLDFTEIAEFVTFLEQFPSENAS